MSLEHYIKDDWERLMIRCEFFFTLILTHFILELIFKVKVIAKKLYHIIFICKYQTKILGL